MASNSPSPGSTSRRRQTGAMIRESAAMLWVCLAAMSSASVSGSPRSEIQQPLLASALLRTGGNLHGMGHLRRLANATATDMGANATKGCVGEAVCSRSRTKNPNFCPLPDFWRLSSASSGRYWEGFLKYAFACADLLSLWDPSSSSRPMMQRDPCDGHRNPDLDRSQPSR
jgi:hypothetical protein